MRVDKSLDVLHLDELLDRLRQIIFYRVGHSRIAIYAKHEALPAYNTEAERRRE